MNIIYLDIETIPCQSADYRAEVRSGLKAPGQYKKPDSIAQWMAENADAAVEEAVAKTSFDPAHGHICCLGWAIEQGDVRSHSARDLASEGDVIQSFYDSLPDLGMMRIVGHNVAAFDLRFLLCRSIALGVTIPKTISRDTKPWSEFVFDTMIAWAGNGGRISQDRLAKALGLKGKGDFDGSMVAQAWANGEHDRIASYCRDDVETVRAIHKKFEAVGY